MPHLTQQRKHAEILQVISVMHCRAGCIQHVLCIYHLCHVREVVQHLSVICHSAISFISAIARRYFARGNIRPLGDSSPVASVARPEPKGGIAKWHPLNTPLGVHCMHRSRSKPCDKQTERQTNITNIGKNSQHLMHSMQPKNQLQHTRSHV